MSNNSEAVTPADIKTVLKETLQDYIKGEQDKILIELKSRASNGFSFADLQIHKSNLDWVKLLGLKVEKIERNCISTSDFITVSISGWAD